jgi:hypothetical protein
MSIGNSAAEPNAFTKSHADEQTRAAAGNHSKITDATTDAAECSAKVVCLLVVQQSKTGGLRSP